MKFVSFSYTYGEVSSQLSSSDGWVVMVSIRTIVGGGELILAVYTHVRNDFRALNGEPWTERDMTQAQVPFSLFDMRRMNVPHDKVKWFLHAICDMAVAPHVDRWRR